MPDVLVTHPYEGGHPDHDSVSFASFFACRALVRLGKKAPKIVEMTSYFGRSGNRVVGEFLQGMAGALPVELGRHECELKLKMYGKLSSQRALLAEFPVQNEMFRLAPSYDYFSKPSAAEVYYDAHNLGTGSDDWLKLACEARKFFDGSEFLHRCDSNGKLA